MRTATATGPVQVGFPVLTFSPDGGALALASGSGGTATIFDTATGDVRHVVHADIGLPQAAFSPDGRSLATASSDPAGGSVTVFDTTSWKVRATVRVPAVPDGIAYANGGRDLVTTSASRPVSSSAVVEIRDAFTLRLIGEPVSVPTPEAFLAFANGRGTQVGIGATNGNAVVLEVDPDSWVASACRIAGRNLTHAEWSEYLPGRRYHASCAEWPAGQ